MIRVFIGLLAMLLPGAVFGQGTPQGRDIPLRYGLGALITTQTRPTGLGDNVNELDQLYARFDGHMIFVGITGNLANSGNSVLLLLDTKEGGSATFNYTGPDAAPAVQRLNGAVFDPGFAPDYLLDLCYKDGTLQVDRYDLQANTRSAMGNVVEGGSVGLLGTSGGIAFVNGNTAGVSDASALDADGNPLAPTATSGLDMDLAPEDVGSPGTSLKVMAILTAGANVSNQVLPGLPDTLANLGDTEPLRFDQYPGRQFATVGLKYESIDRAPAGTLWAHAPVFLSGRADVDSHPPVTSLPTIINGRGYVVEDVADAAGRHTANIVALDLPASVGVPKLVPAFSNRVAPDGALLPGRVTGLDGPVYGRVVLAGFASGSRLYALTVNGTLYAMDEATGANLRVYTPFSTGAGPAASTAVTTPAVLDVNGVPAVFLTGKVGGTVYLARLEDRPDAPPAVLLPLLGATDAIGSPSASRGGLRVQIATMNGTTGAVYTVDTQNMTVYTMAATNSPICADPVLTYSSNTMILGDANPGGPSTFYAFNASNANLMDMHEVPGQVLASAFEVYPVNVAYFVTDSGHVFRASVFENEASDPLVLEDVTTVPAVASGMPIVSVILTPGEPKFVMTPTRSGLYMFPTAPPCVPQRYPVQCEVLTPAIASPAPAATILVTSANGAGSDAANPFTGFRGGNVYALRGPYP